MAASDLHGSSGWTSRVIDKFREEGADKLLLLGDLLYHGPRNDLPGDYRPKEVIEMLNGIRESIIAVRGNCDTEADAKTDTETQKVREKETDANARSVKAGRCQ